MDRRTFLASIAAAVVSGLAACSGDQARDAQPAAGSGGSALRAAGVAPRFTAPRFIGSDGLKKVPVPHGTLFQLPGHTKAIALTVDDGTNAGGGRGLREACP